MVLVLAVGLVAASQSGNIVRLGDAHAVAIAAWRLTIASLLFAVLAGKRLASLGRLSGTDVGLLLVAGVALAFHFFTWIAAVQITTIANAAICFSVNPVLTATAAHLLFGERFTPRLLIAIALGLSGVAVLGAGDLHFETERLPGDALALLSSILFTVYFLLGKRLRRLLDIRSYVTALYGVAGLCGFLGVALLGLPAVDYDARTWTCFLAMALVPTMLGHTGLNYALKYMDAGRISALTLTEPAMAGAVAYWVWGEALTPQAGIAYTLACASVLVLVSDRGGESIPR